MKKALTLSEILITLTIIGVITAITLPVFINKINNIVTINKLKRIYSVLSQCLLKTKASDIDFSDFVIKDYDDASIYEFYSKVFKPNLKIINECIDNTGCWANDTKTIGKVKPYMFSPDKGIGQNIIVFNTTDGYSISLDAYYAGKFDVNVSYNNGSTGSLVIVVDINGNKKPNIIGKDTFLLVYNGYSIVPAGKDASDTTINKNCSENNTTNLGGYYCLEKIVRDDWKINY